MNPSHTTTAAGMNPTPVRTILLLAVLATTSYSLAMEAVLAHDGQATITNVPGYFMQDLDETDPALFDYVGPLSST